MNLSPLFLTLSGLLCHRPFPVKQMIHEFFNVQGNEAMFLSKHRTIRPRLETHVSVTIVTWRGKRECEESEIQNWENILSREFIETPEIVSELFYVPKVGLFSFLIIFKRTPEL